MVTRAVNVFLTFITSINDVIIRIGRTLAWICVSLMVASILLQVFFRYVLNSALPWPEEVARAFMIWMTAFVAAGAYRQGGFIAIDFFLQAIPRKFSTILQFVLLLIAGIVLVELFILGIEFFQRGFRTRAASFNLPRAWIYLAMPVCFGTMLLVNIELVIKQGLCLFSSKQEIETGHS